MDPYWVVPWSVDFHTDFVPEFAALPEAVQDALLAHVAVLEVFGPQLGRPRVDTLNGSRYTNMKELRLDAATGVWRFAFAFDPERQGIVLCGGRSTRRDVLAWRVEGGEGVRGGQRGGGGVPGK